MKEQHFIFGAIIGAIALIVLITVLARPGAITRNRIEEAHGNVRSYPNPGPRTTLAIKDYWDQPLIFKFQREPKQLTYTVLSIGPDGKEGTDDDYVDTRVDYNVSRMVGEWVGAKAKEFGKGIIEGAKKKSPYEEPQPEKTETK